MVCVQARELWSEEERVHLRPGHFWLALLRREFGRRERAISILQRKHIDLDAGKIFIANFKSAKKKIICASVM